MRADIVPGGTFPDYELTDHTKTRRKLSELQGTDPMILVLSRGSYCPKDHQQHQELAANYPKIAVAYTQIVTITTDNILETNEFRYQVGAQWTFLSDAGRHGRGCADAPADQDESARAPGPPCRAWSSCVPDRAVTRCGVNDTMVWLAD
jgi:peroxiredoxin